MQATITRSNQPAASDMRPEERQQSLTSRDTGGVVLLDDLGVLVFEGGDVAAFLQGYLTTDTAELGGKPQFTAMCNIKGRVVCTGYTWFKNGSATLVMHDSLCPVVLDFLRPYLAFSKTASSLAPLSVVGALHQDAAAAEVGALSGGRLGDGRHLYALDAALAGNWQGQAPVVERIRWDQALIEAREVWAAGRDQRQVSAADARPR